VLKNEFQQQQKSLPSETIPRRKRIFMIVSVSSGNLVEWFDFYVYSFCSIYFAQVFFPNGDLTAQLLNTAGIFATGFFMRPIGAWLLGRYADKHGRRSAMLISVAMMGGGSLAIALLPTAGTIGMWAPILLLTARLIQGLSVGGEYGTSAAYMMEASPPQERGFFVSFHHSTLMGGQLLALLALITLQWCLSEEELKLWGWRIPFVLGAAAAVATLFLRKSLHESAPTEMLKRKESGTLQALTRHKKAFLQVLALSAGGTLIFYTLTTYMQKYLVNSGHMDKKTASIIMTAALFISMLLQPFFGALSDKTGRRRFMIYFSSLSTISIMPILHFIRETHSPFVAFGLVLFELIILSFYSSISGLVKAEMFPPHVRSLGVGLGHSIPVALFGGTAEYVALTLKSLGLENLFFFYVTVFCVLLWIVSIYMPDMRKEAV
jgi:MHS family alpha-ketoglutarate permease-like MFS transporter